MKNLDDVVYNMTNSTFEESMKLLFELDDKIKVNLKKNIDKRPIYMYTTN